MPDHTETGVTPETPDHQNRPEAPDPVDDDRSPDALHRALQSERQAKKNAEDARRKTEKERVELARKLREFEEAEEQRKNGEMSEMDRLRKERAEQTRKLQEAEQRSATDKAALIATRLDVAVERQAGTMGFQYPDIAPQLIDRSRVPIDPDTGQADPKDIKDALERLIKAKPGLLVSKTGGGTPPLDRPRRPASTAPEREFAASSVGSDLERHIGTY